MCRVCPVSEWAVVIPGRKAGEGVDGQLGEAAVTARAWGRPGYNWESREI